MGEGITEGMLKIYSWFLSTFCIFYWIIFVAIKLTGISFLKELRFIHMAKIHLLEDCFISHWNLTYLSGLVFFNSDKVDLVDLYRPSHL